MPFSRQYLAVSSSERLAVSKTAWNLSFEDQFFAFLLLVGLFSKTLVLYL
ncbi:hypothetical protein [Halanaerobium congolense]|nr:hypothetical protein [Halanaerobium congolense]